MNTEQASNNGSAPAVRGLRVLVLGTMLTLTACATSPPPETQTTAAPQPSVEVYFYPTKGQSPAQQERDRYECYLWARDQTGFDPSLPQLAPNQRVRVEPAPPSGQKAATGALLGAIFGAAASRPGEEGEGATKGAIAGAIVGGAADAAEAEQAQRAQQQQQAAIDARIARQADEYRRAMSACLEGRGYKVK